ncbi:non-ribosomal peptide synthetase [Solihabitans fulvus]|nr:non-ribosomal peptide synthetase [Solihabitans fulvus]
MAQDLLLELHRRGVRLRLTDDGRLDVLAPAGALTEELRTQLRKHRDHLVAMLRLSAGAEHLAEIAADPARRHEPFPLTDIQHAYWVGRAPAVELGGVATHFYVELERDGIDIPRLSASLRRVIQRHDMLRAVIQPDGSQRVLSEVPDYDIAVADLAGLDPATQRARIAGIRAEMGHQVLAADRWPLFEIRATLLDHERMRLHVSLDLLIADAFSMYLLFQDWRRFCEDPDWSPEPLAVSFRDHVMTEQAARGGDAYRQARDYWLARLDSLPPAPALPLAVRPAQLPRPEFTRRRASLAPARWDAVKREAHRRGLTPSSVLATAFAEVLRLWSNQTRFTLNLSLFNRPPAHPQINQVIGDFTSVTLLEVDAAPEEAFWVRVQRLQRQLMRDLGHLSYSGVRVQRERAKRVGGGPTAAMPIVFTSALALSPVEDVTDGRSFFGGTGYFGTFTYGISQTPQVWLDHQVAEEQGELFVNWDAVEALFPPGLLDDMFAAYRGLLDRLSVEADLWDRRGSMVSVPERQAAERAAANDTAADYPPRTLCGLVADQVRARPDAVAVLAADGQLTYRELAGQAHRLARRLGALAAAADTALVGVVLPKGCEQVASVLGVAWSGAAYLPIDPEWPAARRRQLLEQGGVRTVVTTPGLRDKLTWLPGITLVTLADREVREADPACPEAAPAPEDLAYVIFTSGSTGQPKGVMIDHRAVANTIQDLNTRFAVGPQDRVLALSALSFDLSVYDVFGILAAGATVVMPDPEGGHDPAHWTDLISRHGVTVWNSVPALMQVWLDAPWTRAEPPPLRLVLLSGDWIPVTLPDAVRARAPRAKLVSLGGATEASIWSVCHPIGQVPADLVRIPYGRPLANQTLHVLDDRLADCPVWTVGEIHIGGAGLALGYWADPARTAERFLLRPGTGERLYRTGDHGRYLPGGDIEILGRTDNQIKLNGYRIELGEITSTLQRQPGVRDAVVTVDTNPATGRRQLVAYVVPERGADGNWPALVAAGSDRREREASTGADGLADYAAVIRAFNETTTPLIAASLAGLGEFTAEGDRADAGGIVERHDLRPRYRGLLAEWLALLAGEGLLAAAGRPGEYICRRPLDASVLDARVRRGLAALPVDGALGVLAGNFADCARHQLDLLRGRTNALEFLIPDGGLHVADAMYADNPMARMQNRIVASLAWSFVDSRADGRPMRVLEVGAGCGATTAQVLPELPPDRASYRFTDVSSYFTQRARARFADHTFVDYAQFDINRPPQEQGVAADSVDLIIAANVLHNAADLDQTLRHLRVALDRDGLLVLVENTRNEPFHTVTVGFYQDFGDYRDGRRLPLLGPDQWRSALRSAGFPLTEAIPGAGADPLGQHVLVGAEGTGRDADPARLRDALAELLPGYMVPTHYQLIDRTPLSGNGKVDLTAVPSPWEGGQAARVDPRGELERQIFEIWRDALARDDFGVDDNFFELGGDSLHAVRVIARLREELGVAMTADEGLQVLFDSPTVAEMAGTLRPVTEP